METNKWLFFGVPVALIAVVLGVTEFQRYRLAQPAKGQVEEGFGEAVAVFYPGTHLSNANKFDPAPLYCRAIECRIPATIIDAQGRTASIPVEGNNTSQPVSISPDGKHVGIMDYHHIFHYTAGAFTTYTNDGGERFGGKMVVDDQGKVRAINLHWLVPHGDSSTPGALVQTYGAQHQAQMTKGGDGTLYSCDGKEMVIEAPEGPMHDTGPKEMHINPETGSVEPVGNLPELASGTVIEAVCNKDGNGTMTFLLAGPTIQDQDLKSIRLYEKPWGEPFKPLTDKTMVHFNFTNHEYRYGMVRDDEAVWMLSDTRQIRRIDLKTGEATTAWEMKDAFNEEAPGRTNGMMFDKYVVYIGLKPGSSRDYIARVYDRKTGDIKLIKELPILKKVYGGKDIMSITVRDADALYSWIEHRPDIGI